MLSVQSLLSSVRVGGAMGVEKGMRLDGNGERNMLKWEKRA